MIGVETIFVSPAQYLIVSAVIVVAAAVYVALGFGAGLIAVGTLALVLPDIQDVVVLLLLLGLPAEILVVSTSWRHIRWRGILSLFAGIAVGIPAGSWLLRWGEPTFLLVLLGVFLVVAGSAFLLAPKRTVGCFPTWVSAPVGLSSGLLTGLFGTGGPPLIFYYQLQGVPKTVFRGSLMALFLGMTFVRVPSYALMGLITAPRLASTIAILPAMGLGAWLGHRAQLALDEATFRRMVSGALVVIGVLLLLGRG